MLRLVIVKVPGCGISVSGRPCLFCQCFYLFNVFYGRLILRALINGSSRKFYTWWILSVIKEVTTWIFFLVLLKLQGGPKSDEIWHIFRPRPQTFRSHARMRQNVVILIF